MRRHVTVTVADSHAGALDDLAGRLAQAGMQVEQVLGVLGVVTGRLDDEHFAAVARLPGVAAVEEQAAFGLAPPDAELQ